MREEAYTELFKMYQSALYLYLYRMCGSKEVAEELVQDTFYRAMLSLRMEHHAYARAWLYKVARNLFLDWYRKRKREERILQEIEVMGTGMSQLPTPEEAIQRTEQRIEIAVMMRQLPEHYRAILYLREIEGFTYQELANILDLSLDQVKIQLYRSREKFKRLVQASGKGERNE